MNTGNLDYSDMIVNYRSGTNIIGAALYIFYFVRFYKLSKVYKPETMLDPG